MDRGGRARLRYLSRAPLVPSYATGARSAIRQKNSSTVLLTDFENSLIVGNTNKLSTKC